MPARRRRAKPAKARRSTQQIVSDEGREGADLHFSTLVASPVRGMLTANIECCAQTSAEGGRGRVSWAVFGIVVNLVSLKPTRCLVDEWISYGVVVTKSFILRIDAHPLRVLSRSGVSAMWGVTDAREHPHDAANPCYRDVAAKRSGSPYTRV